MRVGRRGFLRLAGSGLLMAAAPAVALAEPERRYWQVPGNAPVRSGSEVALWNEMAQRRAAAMERALENQRAAARDLLQGSRLASLDGPAALYVSPQTYRELAEELGESPVAEARRLADEVQSSYEQVCGGKLFGLHQLEHGRGFFHVDATGVREIPYDEIFKGAGP